eukprot:6228880-Prymnesium_polylepis.1
MLPSTAPTSPNVSRARRAAKAPSMSMHRLPRRPSPPSSAALASKAPSACCKRMPTRTAKAHARMSKRADPYSFLGAADVTIRTTKASTTLRPPGPNQHTAAHAATRPVTPSSWSSAASSSSLRCALRSVSPTAAT